MTRAPSQHLLARRLKLSGATVSRALANHPALSAETRARVQALAAELGYRGTAGRSVRRTADAPALKIGVLLGEPLVAADHLALPRILEGIRARALETGQENLRLSTLSTTLSARQFELEKARYESGLSTFRAVQQSQDDLDLARLAELQARISLRVAQANLDRLEGTALTRYRLTLFP